MNPPSPLLAHAVPPLSFLFLILACWGFCVITSMLLVVLPFAFLEGPALWKPMLMTNGISILILFTLGMILHTNHPTFTVEFSWIGVLITLGPAIVIFMTLLVALVVSKMRK